MDNFFSGKHLKLDFSDKIMSGNANPLYNFSIDMGVILENLETVGQYVSKIFLAIFQGKRSFNSHRCLLMNNVRKISFVVL